MLNARLRRPTRPTLSLAPPETEEMFLADLQVAHKLIDSAHRAENPERAQRFYMLARSAYRDIEEQARDLPHNQSHRVTARLAALQQRLQEFERTRD